MSRLEKPSKHADMSQGLLDIDADWAAQLKARKDLDQITKSAELAIEEAIAALNQYREIKGKVQSSTDLDFAGLAQLMTAMDRVIKET